LFDDPVCEVTDGSIRYIFRRNPVRAQEIQENRKSKKCSIERLVEEQNKYLREHRGAKEITALKRIVGKIKKLEVDGWISVKVEDVRHEAA
jgi:hypothetical protein